MGSGLKVCIKLSIFEVNLIYFILLVDYKFGEMWVSVKSIDKIVYLWIRDLSLSLAYTRSQLLFLPIDKKIIIIEGHCIFQLHNNYKV